MSKGARRERAREKKKPVYQFGREIKLGLNNLSKKSNSVFTALTAFPRTSYPAKKNRKMGENERGVQPGNN